MLTATYEAYLLFWRVTVAVCIRPGRAVIEAGEVNGAVLRVPSSASATTDETVTVQILAVPLSLLIVIVEHRCKHIL